MLLCQKIPLITEVAYNNKQRELIVRFSLKNLNNNLNSRGNKI